MERVNMDYNDLCIHYDIYETMIFTRHCFSRDFSEVHSRIQKLDFPPLKLHLFSKNYTDRQQSETQT